MNDEKNLKVAKLDSASEIASITAGIAPAGQLSIMDLAIAKGGPRAVVDTMIEIMETFRHGAIKLTSPEDWLLFRSIDKQSQSELISGYLQDKGCERVAKLYGIRIYDVSDATKLSGDQADDYSYTQTASGECARTGEVVEKLLGNRSSTDDIAAQWREEGLSENQIEIRVQKSCRANLDGNIIRTLTGLNSVPLRELQDAWKGTNKDWSQCVRGRGWKGYQAQADKLSDVGGTDVGEVTGGILAPKCPKCGANMKLRKEGQWGPWYSCSRYPQCKGSMNQKKWEDELKKNKTQEKKEDPILRKEDTQKVEATEKDTLLKKLEAIQQDKDAPKVVASNGANVKSYIASLIIADLSTDDLRKITDRLQSSLDKYKKGKKE